MNRYLSILAAAACHLAVPATAATIGYGGEATVNINGGRDADSFSLLAGTSIATAEEAGGTISARAQGFVDPVTGDLMSASAALLGFNSIFATGQASSTTRLSEVLTVEGSGTVSARMRVSGTIELLGEFAEGGFFASVGLRNGELLVSDFLEADTSTPESVVEGRVFDLLSAEVEVTSGDQLIVLADLRSRARIDDLIGSSAFDFGSTASLALVTSGGVQLTPADAAFLSNPTFDGVAEVPVPGALVLFLSSLLCLRLPHWLRLRRVPVNA